MILRRVIVHVSEQNWTAIALDFLIVVLGVFVGLQASNWNAANADRREIARYLDDIASDVRADIEELSRTDAASRGRIAASAYALCKAGFDGQVTELALSQPSANDVFRGAERFTIPDVDPPGEEQRNRLPAVSGMLAPAQGADELIVEPGRILVH